MDKATPFLTDIKELQRRAREHVEKGAVTLAYRGDVSAWRCSSTECSMN
jgi:bacterioferritin